VLKAIETYDLEQRLAKLENANEHVASLTACGYRFALRQACYRPLKRMGGTPNPRKKTPSPCSRGTALSCWQTLPLVQADTPAIVLATA
jgi:hypothetical protein